MWVGAAVTALLFRIGKSLIGLYMGRSTVASVYGAAGSLIVIDLDARLEQLAELRATRLANDVVVDRAGQQHDDPHAAAGRLDERPGHLVSGRK